MKESALVIFQENLPEKNEEWWKQFDTIIAPRKLESIILQRGLSFIDIDSLIDSGNVHEASEFVRKLSLLTVSDGRRISKLVNYQGYELWWINYDNFMYKFCLPYTQYSRLLQYLKDFSRLYIYKPPFCDLFSCFLKSHKCKYVIDKEFKNKIPLGILFQVVLSTPFLLWAKIRRPKLMLWTSDLFDGSNDYDFRMKFIYEELRTKKINFIEFIRSMESSSIVVRHVFKRKRPVIYSFAIVKLAHYFANLFSTKNKGELHNLCPRTDADSSQLFWFTVGTHYLNNYKSDIRAIMILKLILKFIGIKVAIISAGNSRNFHELIACKLMNINTVGILHGASSKTYPVYDFMPEFDGEKQLSVDKYGLWSEWWKEYYLKNSRAYKPEQLYISGPMRPFEYRNISSQTPRREGDVIKVLFVPGELADHWETMPYLLSLMRTKNLSVYLTFRPYRDGFERWLKENHPEIFEKFGEEKIIRGSIHEAINQCDVVVGCYSTAVLEAVLQFKPFIFFQTNKWGDYFELKSFDSPHHFFAGNPQELIEYALRSHDVSTEVLKKLQSRFFGDSQMNGSKWVVEQAEKFL